MKVYFDMVGCRLNQAEIDLFSLKYASSGHDVVDNPLDADLIFINTCCVTKKASADSRKKIRKFQRETNGRVIAMGCWPSAMYDDAIKLLQSQDIILNDEKYRLLDYSAIDLTGIDEKPLLGSRNRTRAFVKVQDGCRNACSFCLTTIARGQSRSLPAEQIVSFVQRLEFLGYNEIVLTGVQLGSWGKDFDLSSTIVSLITQILNKTTIPRIRLSSIEPWDVSKELINLFSNKRLCSHLHIPIQSGSDYVLKAMRRPGSASGLIELFSMIKKKAPQINLSSDILVGFPGEEEEDFMQTIRLIKEIGLNDGHVFSFSPMPKTIAASFEKAVTPAIIKTRNQIVRNLLDDLNRDYRRKQIGQTAEVLFESQLHIDMKCYMSGLTETMQRVLVHSSTDLSNHICKVELVESINDKKFIGKFISEDFTY